MDILDAELNILKKENLLSVKLMEALQNYFFHRKCGLLPLDLIQSNYRTVRSHGLELKTLTYTVVSRVF